MLIKIFAIRNIELIDHISVIMPYYNNPTTLIEAVKSVLFQSTKIEVTLLIIDDGSNESPKNIIDLNFGKFLSISSNRIIKIITQENQGAAKARNKGIEESKTDYIAFLDCDDLWHENKLQLQLDLIENYNLDVIGSDWNNKSHYSKLSNLIGEKSFYKVSKIQIALKWWPHISTIVIRKKIVEKFGGLDNNFHYADDGDFFLNIANHCDFNIINKSLVKCHTFKEFEFADGLSSNLHGMYLNEIETIDKHFNNISIKYFIYFWITIKYYKRLLKNFFLKLK